MKKAAGSQTYDLEVGGGGGRGLYKKRDGQGESDGEVERKKNDDREA